MVRAEAGESTLTGLCAGRGMGGGAVSRAAQPHRAPAWACVSGSGWVLLTSVFRKLQTCFSPATGLRTTSVSRGVPLEGPHSRFASEVTHEAAVGEAGLRSTGGGGSFEVVPELLN